MAFPQIIIAVLYTWNQVHFEWPQMKEHIRIPTYPLAWIFFFIDTLKVIIGSIILRVVFKSQFFLSLLEVEFARIKIEE